MPKKFKLNYVIIPFLTILVASIGSLTTKLGMGWYNGLNFPAFVPSGAFIGMVWTVIFILSTISALMFYNNADKSPRSMIISLLFFNNAFLNILWSSLFFGEHLMGLALVEMIVLNIVNLAMILLLWKKHLTPALLLVPYFIWVCVATYLNYSLWSIN
ncbi:MAG: TspO/MBR family protein [Candidatus Falkowbacteria bacterium]